ncbi:hypothetical protein SYNPS1DRAFT_26611 [Syncephalis pseudoplumigaleata]|uniref:G-protein coupled receptors family 3 profile domain-containing protein n=1 Tax=Syncephalis pseudoplumigaleata TaxID=1712513 RepID=A0A4P9Z577_9FUNG|nr:hypothetical protein SYNPS1DRAFT_26611 [Syncephalis pseudoplumigaleata]|eukprot:RKP27753.1 hypothetical protein SYNPS1DRAFT_26611 [Syncephalis pseudoplumigaleata]
MALNVHLLLLLPLLSPTTMVAAWTEFFDADSSGPSMAIPLLSGTEPLEAVRGRLATATMEVNVTFFSGGNLPYGRVYVASRRLDPADQAVYLLKLHGNPLSSNIDLSASIAGTNGSTTVGYCQGIEGVYDPDFRYPNQPQQVIPVGTGAAPIVSEASMLAWNGLPDDGGPFKESDFVPDRENIVNTWRTVAQPVHIPPPDTPTKYRCRPGRFGSCMLGDLSASLNATLHPPTQNITEARLTVSLHPRLETRKGARAFINYSLALHRVNQPQVVYACTNLAPVDVRRDPEPDFFSFSPTNDRWYMASERNRFVGRMINRGILSIVLYFALTNAINASVLLHRDRKNPARWLLVMLTMGVLVAHLPLIPQLLVGDGDSGDQIVPCSVIRAIGLVTGYLCTGAVAGVLLVKAYFGHKRAYWVAIVGVCVEIVVVALLTYNASRAYANNVRHLPTDGCLAPYVLFGISATTFYSKIVIDVISNLLCSGLFLAVVMRHRCAMGSTSARVYDALARDGLIFLVCACVSSVLCPLLYVSQAMPPFITNTLYSIDYVVASSLIVQQLLRGEAVRQQRKAEALAMTMAAHKRSAQSPKSTKRKLRFNVATNNSSGGSGGKKSAMGSGKLHAARPRGPTFASTLTGGRRPHRDSNLSIWTDAGANNTFFSATSTNMSYINEHDMDDAVDLAIRLKEARERAAANRHSQLQSLQPQPQHSSSYPESPLSLTSTAGVSLLDVPPAYRLTVEEAEAAAASSSSSSNNHMRQRLRDSVASRRTKYLSALSFIRPLNQQRSFEEASVVTATSSINHNNSNHNIDDDDDNDDADKIEEIEAAAAATTSSTHQEAEEATATTTTTSTDDAGNYTVPLRRC